VEKWSINYDFLYSYTITELNNALSIDNRAPFYDNQPHLTFQTVLTHTGHYILDVADYRASDKHIDGLEQNYCNSFTIVKELL